MKFDMKTIITTIVVCLSLIGGILAFDDRYVTAKELAKLEQQTVQTLQQFQVNQERRFLEQRYQTLTDQAMRQKQLIKTYPNSQELKDDLIEINKERDKVREDLNKMK